MNEEKKIEVEEVDAVETPPRARLSRATSAAPGSLELAAALLADDAHRDRALGVLGGERRLQDLELAIVADPGLNSLRGIITSGTTENLFVNDILN